MIRSAADSLRLLAEKGLLRTLRPLESTSGPQVIKDGRSLWNFSSNDYLGLAQHSRITDALVEGVQRYGAGAAASRLVCGSLPPHRALEEALAACKQSEASLLFSSGFAVALGVIPAVVEKNDFVILDKLSHACLVDGARLSGATLRIFPHNDLVKLERLLASIRAESKNARILVVTESVFSMDGDLCPLREILDLTESYQAFLLLDEAHGFGVLGASGMGLAEELGVQSRVTFQMGTLSKAAGLAGGYLTASQVWIDLITNRARSFIYSTAPPPAIAHAALVSLALIRSAEGDALRLRIAENITVISQSLTPIVPIILGSNDTTLAAATSLEESGFLVPAIRYPTVPRGKSRLRISLSAAHTSDAVNSLSAALIKCGLENG